MKLGTARRQAEGRRGVNLEDGQLGGGASRLRAGEKRRRRPFGAKTLGRVGQPLWWAYSSCGLSPYYYHHMGGGGVLAFPHGLTHSTQHPVLLLWFACLDCVFSGWLVSVLALPLNALPPILLNVWFFLFLLSLHAGFNTLFCTDRTATF
jgi:hypothetical protein